MSYTNGLAGTRGREPPFGAFRSLQHLEAHVELESVTSSWEEDPAAPQDIRQQLQFLQRMIIKKERECQDADARTRLELEDMEGQLRFSESERQRLVDEVARLKATMAHTPPTVVTPVVDQSELIHQATAQMREEFELARMHDDLLRRSEAERHSRLEEAANAEMKVREKRLQRLLEEETEMAREREESLKRQLAEENQLAEDRLRKREALLREQMQEDQDRYDSRVADLKRQLQDERDRGHEQLRQIEELKALVAQLRSGTGVDRARLEDEMNARLRDREEELRQREARIMDLQRQADKGKEERLEEEYRRRDEQRQKREAELLEEIEKLRAQLKAQREKADANEQSLHEELAQLKRAAGDAEGSLRGRVAQCEGEIEHLKVILARERGEHESTLKKHADEKDAWDALRKELEDALAAERQKLVNEREVWERDMNAERECLNNLMELELGRQRQELQEVHETKMEVLRQQLEDAKAQAQVAPSPPVLRRPTSSVSVKSRPQPQPSSEEASVRRPYVPPSPSTPVQTPLGHSVVSLGDDTNKNRALLHELDSARHQIDSLKRRIEEMNEEIEVLRKREKDRIAAEVRDANDRIAQLRTHKGSLEEAKTDVERKLREANMLLSEQSLQAKKAERMAAAELQDLKDSHHDEMKRAQARYRDLEDQLRSAQDQLRMLQDQIRDAERALGDERDRGVQRFSEAQLQQQLAQLTAEVNTLRQQLARRSEELAAKAVELAAAQGELTAKTTEMLNLQSKLAASDDKIEALTKALQERDALVKTQAELAAAEQEKQDEMVRLFESKCNEHQQQLEQLQALLHRRQEELDIATIEAGGVRRDVDALRAENSRLREELFSTRDHLRKELEALRDDSQALERRAFSAEREAAVQREHADGLQQVLAERSTLETEGRKAATDAMAEAAERELDRLRQQLATKTDQLLMKDRKEEMLNSRLNALLAEIIPGEEHDDPTQAAIEKIRAWKAWVVKAKAAAANQSTLLKKKTEQLRVAVKKLAEFKVLRRKFAAVKKQCYRLQRKLRKLQARKRGVPRKSHRRLDATPLQPSLHHSTQHATVQPHPATPVSPQQHTSTRFTTHHHSMSSSVPEGSPNRVPRIPLPTKSMLDASARRERRTDLSPPPPSYTRDVVSPRLQSPVRRRGASGPSVEQIEEMLVSMEQLIHEPLPGTEPKNLSPKRLDVHGRPVPDVRPYAMSPRLMLAEEPSARALLEAHELSRRRREERAEELSAILLRLNDEIRDLRLKEAELVAYRERTVATIEDQQASLLNDVNYWRQQLSKNEQQGAFDNAAKCRAHIDQSEQDLMALVRQKPEMLIKAEQGQSHLQTELIRTTEQCAVLDAELQQLTAEIDDLRQKEAALHTLTSPNVLAPPASHLPPAQPVPMF